MQPRGADPPKANRKVSEYFSQNFYATTSGHFHTKSMLKLYRGNGCRSVMFSVDYPYEEIRSAANWFDTALKGGLVKTTGIKIGT